MSIEELKKEVLRLFAPSAEEEREVIAAAEEVVEALRPRIPEGELMLVGSVAKGTFLRDADIDVFVLFEPGIGKEEMGARVWSATEGILEDRRMEYAEHPYVRGRYKGRQVDVVPCYRVPSASSIISAVDRTPFHTEYVRKHLSPEQRGEVRILKAFAKGIGVYGSDLKTQGFSGYLLELLILEYGNFESVLEEASGWGPRALLPRGREREASRFPERMVFIDPTDPNRNAAAAVSDTNYGIFVLAAMDFLRRPSLDFFLPPEKIAGPRKRGTHFVEISLPRPEVVEDVLYPQVRKAVKALMAWLERLGFGPIDYTFSVNGEVRILIEVERAMLPEVERHMGPPLWHRRALNFLDKWEGIAMRGPYARDSRLWVDRPRRIRKVEEGIRDCAEKASWGKNLDASKPWIKIIVDEPTEDLIQKYLQYKLRWIK